MARPVSSGALNAVLVIQEPVVKAPGIFPRPDMRAIRPRELRTQRWSPFTLQPYSM